MPESAFTSTGTLELSPVAAAAKTELRPLGGGAAARRDRTNEELPVPELEEEKSGSPVGLIFGVLVLLILGGGGGWWYWNSHQVAPTVAMSSAPASTTAPPAASVADSATKDSATAANLPDSTAVAAAPVDTTATKVAAAPPPRSVLPPDQLDDMLAPIREDLNVGKQRMNEGEYDGAVVRFGNAQDKIAPLAKKYTDVPQIRSLRREINEALSQNRAACKAERDLALAHGSASPPDCP
jgi:hypothetical protein